MYLSQLSLKSMDRTAMRALTDIYRLHQLVMKGFAGYARTDRVLYRVEPEERACLGEDPASPVVIEESELILVYRHIGQLTCVAVPDNEPVWTFLLFYLVDGAHVVAALATHQAGEHH